jgi:hypothetical protein
MRRIRPYIPLDVRVQVAERQATSMLYSKISLGTWYAYTVIVDDGASHSYRLKYLVEMLSEALGDVLQLDHDPALILRQYKVDRRKPPATWYTPNANDPAHLIYRPLRDHGEKTFGRKADAEKTVTTKGSDIWLKSKFSRLEGRTKKRPRAKIPQRKNPWPKGRKLQGRPFQR